MGYPDDRDQDDLVGFSNLDLTANTPESYNSLSEASSSITERDSNMANSSVSKRRREARKASSTSNSASSSKTITGSASKRKKGPVTCPEEGCGKVFELPKDLHKHQKKHTLPVLCSVGHCQDAFPGKKELDRHIRINHKEHAKRIQLPPEGGICPWPDCGKSTTRNDNFKRHMREQHEGVNPDGTPWVLEK
ncbi:hypothetical protein SODALDRAFT_142066 [Sodiomyces alkalinus F11]|uniref:C2H2-type domain-containing protein n=1 Tax=Sodiomyces alkalinus (strain CBS 110278 / VKM F-3762 / F11) TaxID=1314773 RepID=A0A3N2PZT8_SODAK|nr:hypothetical protein SODALDRAFT_142066 [Sodiomyces alkalinus F11]ROT39948.1 hypothetical protein SODALDRAFT_142066 [Sodiomyces alkalinus F11]